MNGMLTKTPKTRESTVFPLPTPNMRSPIQNDPPQKDLGHSTGSEERYYCFGKIGEGIMTVRFTYRYGVIRIFGAGYWRRGKKIYEREN